jgi:intracellular sulfur oxidation DsrE/DsrF family protein
MTLTKHGLEVYLCKVTFATLKVDLAKARTDSYIRLVQSGIAAASALQRKGYSYLKVG